LKKEKRHNVNEKQHGDPMKGYARVETRKNETKVSGGAWTTSRAVGGGQPDGVEMPGV